MTQEQETPTNKLNRVLPIILGIIISYRRYLFGTKGNTFIWQAR